MTKIITRISAQANKIETIKENVEVIQVIKKCKLKSIFITRNSSQF